MLPPPIPGASKNGNASADDLEDKLASGPATPGAAKNSKDDDKIPASVKNVLKNLKAKTDDLTLDDLNAAREAVARLDALIDIEKRLAELDKVKKDRETQNNKNMMAAIPASALIPPMSYTPPPQAPGSQQQMPSYFPSSSIDVTRIEGSNDHYLAFVKEGDTVRQVQTGDHLNDGSLVLGVSPRGIELKRDGTSRMVQVKDVQAVFSEAQ